MATLRCVSSVCSYSPRKNVGSDPAAIYLLHFTAILTFSPLYDPNLSFFPFLSSGKKKKNQKKFAKEKLPARTLHAGKKEKCSQVPEKTPERSCRNNRSGKKTKKIPSPRRRFIFSATGTFPGLFSASNHFQLILLRQRMRRMSRGILIPECHRSDVILKRQITSAGSPAEGLNGHPDPLPETDRIA